MTTQVASVIIPSYNCAQWLPRAVLSACNLYGWTVEVIVVNDGSTDNTKEVCEQLKSAYPSIVVINQANGGLSVARNTGLDAATGDWIIFLDADDELIFVKDEPAIEPDSDLIRIAMEEVPINGDVRRSGNSASRSSAIQYLKDRILDGHLLSSCSYIYSRSLLENNKIRFEPGLIHEDIPFVITALNKAKCISSTEAFVYRYILRENSITTTTEMKALKKRVSSLRYINQKLLRLANENKSIDYWRRAEYFADKAWGIIDANNSMRLKLIALSMELDLFCKYKQWGVLRERREYRWRIRRAITRFAGL